MSQGERISRLALIANTTVAACADYNAAIIKASQEACGSTNGDAYEHLLRLVQAITGVAEPASLAYMTEATDFASTGSSEWPSLVYDFTQRTTMSSRITCTTPDITAAGMNVTGNTDKGLISDLTGWFSATAGTMLAVGTPNDNNAGVNFETLLSFDDNTANERIHIRRTSANVTGSIIIDGGATQASMTGSSWADTTTHKIALAWSASNFAFCDNGGTVGTDSAGTIPTVTQFQIGAGAGATFFNGRLLRFAYWPVRLSNTALQRLTT